MLVDLKEILKTAEENKSINELREYRNDIAHHHTISQDRYKNAQKSLRKINRQLIEAISLIEEKQYTQQDKLYVYVRFFASILNAVKNIRVAIEPLQKSMSEYSKRMAESLKGIDYGSSFAPLVEVANQNAEMIAEYQKMIDYGKVFAPLVETGNRYKQLFAEFGKPIDVEKTRAHLTEISKSFSEYPETIDGTNSIQEGENGNDITESRN